MLGRRIFMKVSSRDFLNGFRRMLFTDESLGLTSFDTFRRKRQDSAISSRDELWRRLDHSNQITADKDEKRTNLVFSEDILQALAIAETHEEVSRVYRAVRPFVQQRMDSGQYRMLKRTAKPIAPLIMKLFHRTRNVDLAFHALTQSDEKALEEFFGSDLNCYQIGMDLFFETRQYQRVLDVWELYEKRRQEAGTDGPFSRLPAFPRSMQVLVLAACYKMNTTESLQFAMNFIESAYDRQSIDRQSVSFPTKALALTSGLAANQGQLELAFEILSLIGNEIVESYTAPRSLKCILLARLSRWPELIQLLRKVLESDLPAEAYQDREISIETVKAVEERIQSIGDTETKERLQRCCSLLRRGGHVVDMTMDRLLCSPVQILPSSSGELRSNLVQQVGPVAVPGATATRVISPMSPFSEAPSKDADEDQEEKNIWERSNVYDDDSSAMATVEKFKENERKLKRIERRKKRILNSVGRWVREEGPFQVDDDRGGK